MTSERPPKWFWISAGLLTLWNLMGLAAFGADLMMSTETMASLPEAHQALYTARPSWVVVAFGVAVLSGTAGSVALLMRRSQATALFGLSIVAVLIQNSWTLMSDVIAVMGTQAVVMPIVVILSLVFGLWLARQGSQKQWFC